MQLPGFVSANVFEAYYPVNLFYLEQAFNGLPGLVGTPGLKNWCDLGVDAPVRGVGVMGGYLYAAAGATLYRIDGTGAATACTGSLLTSTGPVQMATDGATLMVIDFAYGYTVTGPTCTQITDADFPTPSSLTYQDGYFIVTADGTGEFWISDANDPTSWVGTEYGEAQGAPDDAVCAISDHRELIVFGETSVEVYQNTGATDFPFERIEGAYMEIGLGARDSVAKIDNSVLFVAEDRTVRRIEQYSPKVVSPPGLNQLLAAMSTVADARALTYHDRGGSFYALTLPSENKTYALNVATGAWHQWSSGTAGGRHRAICAAAFAGKTILGDYDTGKLYELAAGTYTDAGATIVRQRTAPPVFDPKEGRRLFWRNLQVHFKAGVGLAAGQGSDPQAVLQWSDTHGHTWSNEHWGSFGKIGEYDRICEWWCLGASRHRILRITVTDPVEVVITGAVARVDVGRV